jgi:hypothetical protein
MDLDEEARPVITIERSRRLSRNLLFSCVHVCSSVLDRGGRTLMVNKSIA